MSEIFDGGSPGTGDDASTDVEGLRQSSREVVLLWTRDEWPTPLGYFFSFTYTRRSVRIGDNRFTWVRVDIPELFLSRHAALRLLQGISVSNLLIPNHEIRSSEVIDPKNYVRQLAHLVVHHAGWEPWRSPLSLRDVVLAKLPSLIPNVTDQEVLSALAADALSHPRLENLPPLDVQDVQDVQ